VDLGVTKKHGERRAAEGVPMARGGYRAIKRPGSGGSLCLVKWGDEKHRTAVAIAASTPARIRAGHFEPVQDATGGWKGLAPRHRDHARARATQGGPPVRSAGGGLTHV
jgi:hypothetical protein